MASDDETVAEAIVGEWFYDAGIDESFLVVAPWGTESYDAPTVEGETLGVLQMYADGQAWDATTIDVDIPLQVADVMGFDPEGIDPDGPGGRYRRIEGPFPSLEASDRMCNTGHKYRVHPDDVWHRESEYRPKGELDARHIRCQRCALSRSVLAEYGHENPGLDVWDGERGAFQEYRQHVRDWLDSDGFGAPGGGDGGGE